MLQCIFFPLHLLYAELEGISYFYCRYPHLVYWKGHKYVRVNAILAVFQAKWRIPKSIVWVWMFCHCLKNFSLFSFLSCQWKCQWLLLLVDWLSVCYLTADNGDASSSCSPSKSVYLKLIECLAIEVINYAIKAFNCCTSNCSSENPNQNLIRFLNFFNYQKMYRSRIEAETQKI